MGISKIIQERMSNVFVAIILEGDKYKIKTDIFKNGEVVKSEEKDFKTEAHQDISGYMKKYLKQIQKDYRFVYISYYLDSTGQGAISGYTAKDFSDHSVDIKSVHRLNIDKSWSAYASFIDINWIKNCFEEPGIDFIYSPFVILNDIIKKDGFKQKPTLYMINTDDSFVLGVFKENDLLFGYFSKVEENKDIPSYDYEEEIQEWEEKKPEEGVETLISLDDIDSDEDFGDIGSLDEDDDIELESTQGLSFLDVIDGEEDKRAELELFGKDIILYKNLKKAIDRYYKNDIYKSEFVEDLVIYDDSSGMTKDIIDMIESDLFLNIEIKKVDIRNSMIELSHQEVGI